MHRIASGGIHHIHIAVVQGLDSTEEGIHGLRISDELLGGGVLDEVAFFPRFVRRQHITNYTCGFIEVQIERYPVPTGIDVDILCLTTTGGEEYLCFVSATMDITCTELYIPIDNQVICTPGGCLP